jgi:hypothetical protein
MATLTVEEGAQARAFRIPFKTATLAGTLEIRTAGPDRRPAALALELRPADQAFTLGLPRLLRETGYPGDVFALGRAARAAQPVLVYHARPAVLARVPAGLATLAAFEAYVRTGPHLFDLQDYELAAIAFERGEQPATR